MATELEPTGEEYEPRRSYPWSTWLNGSPWRLVWQEDFDPEPRNFANYAYTRARKAGLRLAIVVEPTDDVVMQSYRPDQRRPVLPTPYRRLANGRTDRTAPATTPVAPAHDPERACGRCGARLSSYASTFGECRKFQDPEWRCAPTKGYTVDDSPETVARNAREFGMSS
jgi:hypothetical protein